MKGRAILGRPVQILCQSDSGSLPISYTLLRSNKPVDTISVQLPSEKAVFTVSVGSAAELSKLTCEARNNPSNAPHSSELEATVVGKCPAVLPEYLQSSWTINHPQDQLVSAVWTEESPPPARPLLQVSEAPAGGIYCFESFVSQHGLTGCNRSVCLLALRSLSCLAEPLSIATLTVIPDPEYIYEEDNLFLICGVKGSPPITFKWFRSGQEEPLHTTIADNNHTDFQIPQLSKGHSDRYHCEAINYANHIRSQPVNIYGETERRTTATDATAPPTVRTTPSAAHRSSGAVPG